MTTLIQAPFLSKIGAYPRQRFSGTNTIKYYYELSLTGMYCHRFIFCQGVDKEGEVIDAPTCKETVSTHIKIGCRNLVFVWKSGDFNALNTINLIRYFEQIFGYSETKAYSFEDAPDAIGLVLAPEWSKTKLRASLMSQLIKTGSYFNGNIEEWLAGKHVGLQPADNDHIRIFADAVRTMLAAGKVEILLGFDEVLLVTFAQSYFAQLRKEVPITEIPLNKPITLRSTGGTKVVVKNLRAYTDGKGAYTILGETWNGI